MNTIRIRTTRTKRKQPFALQVTIFKELLSLLKKIEKSNTNKISYQTNTTENKNDNEQHT